LSRAALRDEHHDRLVAIRRHYERPTIRSFERKRWHALNAATALSDVLALTAGITLASLAPGDIGRGGPQGAWNLVWLGAWMAGIALTGMYDRQRTENPAEELRHGVSGITLGAALAIVASFSAEVSLSRGWALVAWFSALFTVLVSRRIVRKGVHYLRRHGRLRRRAIIVGSDDSARDLGDAVARAPWEGIDVVGYIATEPVKRTKQDGNVIAGGIEHLRELALVLRAEEVLVAPSVVADGRLPEIVSELEGVPVYLRVAPGLEGFLANRLAVHPLGDRALVAIERVELRAAARVAKRIMDLVLGSVLLLIALPVIGVCAAAVRLDSAGPAFFRQRRIGVGGREITVWKLRSMTADAEARRVELVEQNEAEGLLFKMRDDPRVTRVGRFLRKTSLDELAQLFNVIGGSMSLVGPRPPLPEEVARYDDDRLVKRLSVKPGITGLWQVSGRHEVTFEDYVRYDLLYVQNWSVAFDLYILAKTVPAVLFRRGAY
jgi:exopolysaccharide biosynthesis polyprenyl glycosylphosphotransferase